MDSSKEQIITIDDCEDSSRELLFRIVNDQGEPPVGSNLEDVKSFDINNQDITEADFAAYVELKGKVKNLEIFKKSVRAQIRG